MLLAAGALAVIPVAASLAQSPGYSAGAVSYSNADWAAVQKGEVILFALLDGRGAFTKAVRAGIIVNERLAVLEQDDLLSDPGRIEAGDIAGEVGVYVLNPGQAGGLGGKVLIVTVDQNTARALSATRMGVATYWRDLLRLYTGPTGSNPSGLDPAGRPLVPNASWRNIPEKYRAMGGRQSSMSQYTRGGGGGGCCGG